MVSTCINLLLLKGGNSNRSYSLVSISLSDLCERGMIEQVSFISRRPTPASLVRRSGGRN